MAASSKLVRRVQLDGAVMEIHSWNSASVTTGTISVGLSVVDHISPNNLVTEDIGKWTVSGSLVTWAGVTSSDTGTVTVIGLP